MPRRHGRAVVRGLIPALSIPALLVATPLPSAVGGPPPGVEAEVQARGTPPLVDAARRGDEAAVAVLLDEGMDVVAAAADGMTALHWAARNGDAAVAGLLLAAGADTGTTTRLGDYRPVHLAAAAGSGPVVELLLAAGADPEAVTSTGGVTPLHLAAAAGSVEAVTALLDHGAAVDAREELWGQTPLIFAVARDRVEVARTLLARGADVEATTKIVDVPAREAADQAARRAAEQQGAASPDRPAVPAAPARYAGATGPAPEPNEDEPLSYADLVGSIGGLTPLLHAVREGHAGMAMALLEAGAGIDRPSAGDHTSPLLMATINGHFDLALELLGRGADPDVASAAGATPLYAAVNLHWAPKSRYPQPPAYRQQRATYLEVMQALLEAGADPNARLTKHLWYMSYNFDLLDVDTRGATPFWRAAYATDVEAMRLLVAHGADPGIPTEKPPERRRRDPDRPDPSGLPPVPPGGPAVYPIHGASGVGYGQGYAANSHRHVPDGWLPAVQYLVEELGADVNARDLNGYTPLHHAAARGDNELILYLVGQGADVTAVSRRGQTTVDMANGPVQRVQPYPETIALLEGLGARNNHNCVSC